MYNSIIGLFRRLRPSFLPSSPDPGKHWLNPTNYRENWAERARLAVGLLKGNEKRVCDLGCGMQAVRALLPPGSTYLPADQKQWTPDTELCDLNRRQLPPSYLDICDACMLLGVVEYIEDPVWLFAELALRLRALIVSYAFARGGPRNALWVNAYSKGEFIALLERVGFTIEQVVDYGQRTIVIRAVRA